MILNFSSVVQPCSAFTIILFQGAFVFKPKGHMPSHRNATSRSNTVRQGTHNQQDASLL